MTGNLFFIVNTRIGSNRIATFTRALLLHLADIKHEVHLTEYAGHATELATKAVAENASMVIAVGGDGTVNEVLQVLAKSNIPMAIVPTGSGNGLARHCGIPTNIYKAVELIVQGKLEKIDVGRCNHTYFISNAGIGYDAFICNKIKKNKSRGLKMYVWEVCKNYFSYSPKTYKITIDEKVYTHHAFFLNIANGKEFGYGFKIAPDASLQDGWLDVIIVKKITIFNGIKFVWDGWNRKLNTNKDCIHYRAKEIKIESNQDINFFQTDGDGQECNGKCDIEIHPKSLILLIPAKSKNL